MKRIPVLIFFSFLFHWTQAQFCGTSGSFQCTPDQTVSLNPGFYPSSDSFVPFINNHTASAAFQFRNFDTIVFGSQLLHVNWLSFDTIDNLPPGLCWSTDQPNNTYNNGQNGCIHISGSPCGATGQYKLHIIVTVDVGGAFQSDGGPGGLIYFLRLNNYGDPVFPVDLTQTDSDVFIPYGGLCQTVSPLSVSLGRAQTVCPGSIESFTPQISGGVPPYSYAWQSTSNNLSCNNCVDPTVTVSQNDVFHLQVTDANNSTGADSVIYTVTGFPINCQIAAAGPTLFCHGGSVTLNAAPDTGITYEWIANGNFLPDADSSSLQVTDSSGNYQLVFVEDSTCQAKSNIVQLTFFDAPPASISTLGSASLCQGSMVIIEADTSAGVLSYQWQVNGSSDSTTGPVYVATSSGSYNVVVKNIHNCFDTSNVIVVTDNTNFPSAVNLTGYPDTICFNASPITLAGDTPTGGTFTGNAVWNNVFYPDSAFFGSNVITYTYTDGNGCSNWVVDSVLVFFCGANSINELSLENSVSLYPNPAIDILTVESDLFTSKRIQCVVYNLTGQQIGIPFEKHQQKIVFNTALLSSGVYLIHLRVGEERVTKRFVKIN